MEPTNPVNSPHRWHHRPSHLFVPNTAYMVTAGTLHKEHLFRDAQRLCLLRDWLLMLAGQYGWQLQAWAVFSNHYHWIGTAPDDATTLKRFISHLHTKTATEVNKVDASSGRKVWFQYWDTCLTFEKSYLARLNYVHNNALHHRLVPLAEQYEWCSARWFLQEADPSFRKKVESFGCERVKVEDDF
ncbi:MAG: transposase [Verrucomicrobia bacterium]|nr:transposase [Verrucomicrobiota bacterium]